MTNTSAKIVSDALASEIVRNTKLYLNLSQDAIVITEDKVRLCLIEHLKKMEARKEWIAPSAILITLCVTFVTTGFKDFFFKAATWEAVFIIAALLNLSWLVLAVRKAWKAPSVEDVVSIMKKAGASRVEGSTESNTTLNQAIQSTMPPTRYRRTKFRAP